MRQPDHNGSGKGSEDRLIQQCVFDVDTKNGGLTLVELAEGVSVEDVQKGTGCAFKVKEGVTHTY